MAERWTSISKKSRATTRAQGVQAGATAICTSLSGETAEQLGSQAREAILQGTDLVEFRLDLLPPDSLEDIEGTLSEFSGRSIFTVRSAREGGGFRGDEREHHTLLRRLARIEPAYLDIELRSLESSPEMATEVPSGRVIVSWHDPSRTPSRTRLHSILKRARRFGGLAKVVPTATKAIDNLSVLSLYEGPGPAPIAFCMGPTGLYSRVACLQLGAPMAFASHGRTTAPGQLSLHSMLELRRRLQNA